MKLTNTQLQNFIDRIKLKGENMPKYRDQINNLKESLEKKIKEDKRTGMKVTKYLLAGSWKKRTILRPTGENPIDVDLVLYVEGDESLKDDLKKLHDFIVEYLKEIYPNKDIDEDVDAEGNTKSIKIKFTGTGLELDIVPVIPVSNTSEYVCGETGQIDQGNPCQIDHLLRGKLTTPFRSKLTTPKARF